MHRILLKFVAAALVFHAGWISAAEPLRDLPKALEISKKQDKPIFLYVYDSL